MARLASYVVVDGQWYGPDDDVPADIAKRITNPKAWASKDDKSEEDADEPKAPAKKAAPAKK